jgi:amylosucrase
MSSHREKNVNQTSVDWRKAAAEEAIARVSAGLRPSFGRRSWSEFAERLRVHGPRLFELVHHLYGWRYDFAWTYEGLVRVAAGAFRKRRPHLRRSDRDLETALGWLTDSAGLWAAALAGSEPDGVETFLGQLPYLAQLKVSHLHLLTPDPKRIRPFAKALRDHGIRLALDMTCHQTSSDHPWARAVAAGDPHFRGFYHIFPDRSVPDRYAPHLRHQVTEAGGDSFTWYPDVNGGSWVWTTGQPDRWDLDFSNPAVLIAMSTELLALINRGAAVIRIKGAPFLWKAEGTSCEGLPEAHLILQTMRALVDLAAPSVVFWAGTAVGAGEADSFVTAGQCRLASNRLLMSSVWEAQATGDVRLLRIALGERFRLPEGCTWISSLRSEEDIVWNFDDDDALRLGIDPAAHRDYLNQFYGGRWPGSYSSGLVTDDEHGPAISGSASALAGLDQAIADLDPIASDLAARRILAGLAVILGAGGIPSLGLGDGIGQIFEPGGPVDMTGLASTPRDGGPGAMLLAGLTELLEIRRGLPGFGPGVAPVPEDLGDNGVIAFRRGPVLVVVNLTGRTALVSRSGLTDRPLVDHVRKVQWEAPVLGPYEYRYLAV